MNRPDPKLHLEVPLLRLDTVFRAFAQQVGGRIDINYKDSVSRHITVEGVDGLTRKVQISPVLLDIQKGWVEGNYKYLIALMVWKDIDAKRWWWTSKYPLYSDLPNKEEMKAILQKAWGALLKVKESDLALASD